MSKEYLPIQTYIGNSIKNKNLYSSVLGNLESTFTYPSFFNLFKSPHNYVWRDLAFHTLNLLNCTSVWILSGLWNDYFRQVQSHELAKEILGQESQQILEVLFWVIMSLQLNYSNVTKTRARFCGTWHTKFGSQKLSRAGLGQRGPLRP